MIPEIERQAEPAHGWRSIVIESAVGVLLAPILMYAIVAFGSGNPGPFLAYYFEVWREIWWLLLLCGLLIAITKAGGRARRRARAART